jgi:hypothetical protein
LLAS